jgi:hypothetical protein
MLGHITKKVKQGIVRGRGFMMFNDTAKAKGLFAENLGGGGGGCDFLVYRCAIITPLCLGD